MKIKTVFANGLLLCFLVLVFAGLCGLGFWQLNRAEQKRVLLKQFTKSNAVPLQTVEMDPVHFNFQPVSFQGEWQSQKSFLLDNQFSNHQIGYHVITPMHVLNSNNWVLVDRGFIPKQTSFVDKPMALQKPHLIQGRIYAPDRKVLLLGSIENNPTHWPRIIERIDFSAMSKLLGHPVEPFIIWLDPASENGFVREWTPVIMPPERHMAYALQWFGLALVWICGSIASAMKK